MCGIVSYSHPSLRMSYNLWSVQFMTCIISLSYGNNTLAEPRHFLVEETGYKYPAYLILLLLMTWRRRKAGYIDLGLS